MNELTTQQKALIVIEHIALYADEDDKRMGTVYEIAHVANGRCTANHEDWAKLLNDMFDDLVKRGEYHLESAGVSFEQLAKEIREKIDLSICQVCGKKLNNGRCDNKVCPVYTP